MKRRSKSKILGLTPREITHAENRFTLTSFPFYPVPLTPAEVMAMGKNEKGLGNLLRKAIA